MSDIVPSGFQYGSQMRAIGGQEVVEEQPTNIDSQKVEAFSGGAQVSYDIAGKAFDTNAEIEKLQERQDSQSSTIVTYKTDAAAWLVTSLAEKYVCVPKMVTTMSMGTSFALDIFENNPDPTVGNRLTSVFTIDH